MEGYFERYESGMVTFEVPLRLGEIFRWDSIGGYRRSSATIFSRGAEYFCANVRHTVACCVIGSMRENDRLYGLIILTNLGNTEKQSLRTSHHVYRVLCGWSLRLNGSAKWCWQPFEVSRWNRFYTSSFWRGLLQCLGIQTIICSMYLSVGVSSIY